MKYPSIERKSEQLGMSFSTACGRLRKNVMFMLVQGCGMDVCHVCDKRIESASALSIEHKVNWLDVDPALFWDLDNIAFSHLRCNRPERRNGGAVGGRRANTEDDIRRKISVQRNGCMVWGGATTKRGDLPVAYMSNKKVVVVRYLWGLERGPLDRSAFLLRDCTTRWCVNPDHHVLGERRDAIAHRRKNDN